MRLPIVTIILLGLLSFTGAAQNDMPPILMDAALMDFQLPNQGDSSVESTFTFHTSQLEEFIALMDSVDSKEMKAAGYRIQLFSASGPNARKQALQSQTEVLTLYGTIPSYTKWSYPNWVVRVGDFRTRLEAMELHVELREKYPASFIIQDEINVDYR